MVRLVLHHVFFHEADFGYEYRARIFL